MKKSYRVEYANGVVCIFRTFSKKEAFKLAKADVNGFCPIKRVERLRSVIVP